MPNTKSSAAWRELLSAFADYDELFLQGPKAVRGELAVAEGYQFLATMLGLSLDVAFFGDPVAPRFIDVLTPFRHDRRWGGDNTDAYYGYAVVDPRRTYRISGIPNDSVMYSVAVYNEPEPGAWPNRTIGVLYDEAMPLGADGRFSCVLGPQRPDGSNGPFIALDSDARGVLTRDYHEDPKRGRPVEWAIEVIDHAGLPVVPDKTDDAIAARLTATRRYAQDMFNLVPLILLERKPAELADGQTLSLNVLAPPRTVRARPPTVTRCRTRCTAWARSRWSPARRWSSPRGIRSAGSGTSPYGISTWRPSTSITAAPASTRPPPSRTATVRSPSSSAANCSNIPTPSRPKTTPKV